MRNSTFFNIVRSAMTSLVTVTTISVTAANAYTSIAVVTPKQNQVAQWQTAAPTVIKILERGATGYPGFPVVGVAAERVRDYWNQRNQGQGAYSGSSSLSGSSSQNRNPIPNNRYECGPKGCLSR
jgi:hypothetical protein